jgi:hypothetical protein
MGQQALKEEQDLGLRFELIRLFGVLGAPNPLRIKELLVGPHTHTHTHTHTHIPND